MLSLHQRQCHSDEQTLLSAHDEACLAADSSSHSLSEPLPVADLNIADVAIFIPITVFLRTRPLPMSVRIRPPPVEKPDRSRSRSDERRISKGIQTFFLRRDATGFRHRPGSTPRIRRKVFQTSWQHTRQCRPRIPSFWLVRSALVSARRQGPPGKWQAPVAGGKPAAQAIPPTTQPLLDCDLNADIRPPRRDLVERAAVMCSAGVEKERRLLARCAVALPVEVDCGAP